MAKVVEQAKVIRVLRGRSLINRGEVAPGAPVKRWIRWCCIRISLGNQKTAHIIEQVSVGLITWIKEMHVPLVNV